MSTEESQKNKEKSDNSDSAVKPDSETLHTTDPQEHMEGPISSLVKKAEEGFESEDSDKDDKKKDN